MKLKKESSKRKKESKLLGGHFGGKLMQMPKRGTPRDIHGEKILNVNLTFLFVAIFSGRNFRMKKDYNANDSGRTVGSCRDWMVADLREIFT